MPYVYCFKKIFSEVDSDENTRYWEWLGEIVYDC